MTAWPARELLFGEYTLRRFRPEDVSGVVQLVEQVYGHTYYPRELYDREQIVRLNEAGKLISFLALDSAGSVVGHYALERPHGECVAETSDAIVRPEHRHHHLLEQMRVLLREEAVRLGLTGLVGYPVTNHLFSQKAEEHFGAHPCGVALGLWPRTYHEVCEPCSQRMSFILYFNYLRPPRSVLHVPTRHQEMLARISHQYAVPVEAVEPRPPEGAGEVVIEYESFVDVGTIRVVRVGADTAAAISRAREELVNERGAKAITLHLPLDQAGTPDVCRAAEAEGFFFCGLGPAFAAGGDALLLQLLDEPIDPSLLEIESPFAKVLLAYVVRERVRVGQAREA
jgi:hypothetical protein